MNIISFY